MIMDIFAQLAQKIIEEQEHIIGPIALEQARKVQGLTIDWQKREITFEGDKTTVIEGLVEQYKALFGKAAVEACKEAVRGLITQLPQNQIPSLLR